MPTEEELYRQLATSNLPLRSIKEGTGSQDVEPLTREDISNVLKFGSQLGSDLILGSSLAEAFGFRPDIVGGKGYTPSYPELFTQTEQLAKEGKKSEALGKGIETGLVGVGAAGEGMMLAGALTGPLAPYIIGAGLTLKGISKAGKLILQSKTGQRLLANYVGDDAIGYSVSSIEIPKNVSPDLAKADTDVQKIIQDEKIPTTVTDDIDTEVAIPEVAKDLTTTEAVGGYIIDPSILNRNQLVAKIENDPEVKTKTDNYLNSKGFTDDTIPVYRIISVKDKTKGFGLDPKLIQKAEIGEEGIISGSLTPEANIKTIKYFENKGTTEQEIVRYDVPRDRITIAMGGFKNDIKQNVNKNLKSRGFGQRKIPGYETITNPSKSAQKLIDIQDEVIADVSGLKKNVLGSPKVLDYFDMDKVLGGKYEDYKDFKADLPSSRSFASMDDFDNMYNKKISVDQFRKIEDVKTKDAYDRVMNFYRLNPLASALEISQNPTFSRLEDAVNNLKQKKGPGEAFLNRLKGQAKQAELDWTGLTKFLKDKKEVTKEQIQSYMKQHSIAVKEAVYSNNPKDIGWKNNPLYDKWTINFKPNKYDNRNNLKNYREFVFSIPQRWRERNLDYPLTNKEELRLAELVKIGNKYTYNTPKGLTIEWQRLKDKLENYERKNKPLEYDHWHYKHEPNLFSRVRVADRIDSDGNPTVHIEEVQSEYVANVIKAIKKAQKDADSFYNIEGNLLPGITEKDIEILRKGYAPEGIKFRKNKTFEDIKANEKAIAKRTKELEKKYNVNLDKIKDHIGNLRESLKSIQTRLGYKGADYTPSMRNKDTIRFNNIDDELNNQRNILNEFDNLYKKDKIINRLSNKNKSLQNRNRLNELLRNLPPEFPVVSNDWYKFPIDRIIRDAAERDIPSITLTHGRVQYNRYAEGTYETEINKIKARDKIFKNFDSFLKEGSTIAEDISNARALDVFQVKYDLDKIPPVSRTNILEILQKHAKGASSKGKQNIKKLIDDAILIHRSAKVGRNYDTKYVGYLNDIAKKYNAKRDTTFVDNNYKDGMSYRLEITPQMKKDYLKKGAARFKTGGYIRERV